MWGISKSVEITAFVKVHVYLIIAEETIYNQVADKVHCLYCNETMFISSSMSNHRPPEYGHYNGRDWA